MLHRSPPKRDPKKGKEYYAGAAEAADSGEPKLTSTAVRRVRWHGARVLIQKRRRATRRSRSRKKKEAALKLYTQPMLERPSSERQGSQKTGTAYQEGAAMEPTPREPQKQLPNREGGQPRARARSPESSSTVLPIGRGTVQGESGWGPQWPTGPPPETNPFREQGWPERDGDRTSTRGDRRASRRGKRQRRSPSLRAGASRPEALPAR